VPNWREVRQWPGQGNGTGLATQWNGMAGCERQRHTSGAAVYDWQCGTVLWRHTAERAADGCNGGDCGWSRLVEGGPNSSDCGLFGYASAGGQLFRARMRFLLRGRGA
jgi:hypothetical protein